MPNNPSQSSIYESYEMLHPDGTLMCHCNKKRATWYVNRHLAQWVNETTFKLNFEPQEHGKSGDAYYQQKLENKCVVCGHLSGLNKHHVFPYVFRSRLPKKYKESNHHDILPICIDCHEKYEELANIYKMQLAKELGIAMNGSLTAAQKNNRRIISARKALARVDNAIPENRLTILKEKAKEQLLEEDIEAGAIWADNIMEDVLSKHKLQDFIRSWRMHFLEHTKPQFLPELWSVDHPLEVIGNNN